MHHPRPPRRLSVAVCLIILLASACVSPDGPALEPDRLAHRHAPCPPGERACVDVHIVAHEDDDLLFMNPDIADSLARGNHVVTVVLTAGTTWDGARLAAREAGMLNAYTYMVDPALAIATPDELPRLLAHW